MTNWADGNGGGWGFDAPVFVADFEQTFRDTEYPYPGVWITCQRWEPTETSTGRDCIWYYTPDEDKGGWEALRYGGAYYDEGMSCGEDEHKKRVLCFEAAELLYLHSAYLGNPYASLNLGYVYSYNRCEGKFWGYWEPPYTRFDVPIGQSTKGIPYPHEERACECFRTAAEAGIAEACYKLGDMLRDGRGCEPDLSEALTWFQRAYELGRDDSPVVWGSAALRLGRAYEEGEGCEQGFEQAYVWYERASTGLGIAVRGGESWYRGALRRAEAGLKRTRQELSGQY